jgi:branched-chain amino acid transport system substrate-binding protein
MDKHRARGDAIRDHPLSRREFLKIVGIAGATAGLGAGFGGMLAACDETASTTTNARGATTTTVTDTTTTTTAVASSTTVNVGPEAGRDIKIGLASPQTGPLALFGKADDWWTEFALTNQGDGFVCGDGKLHRFTFKKLDSRSDPDHAAQVAGELIAYYHVDIISCSGSSETVNPVVDKAEALECPCISSFVLWESLVSGRIAASDGSPGWTYAHAIGLEDVMGNFMAMWEQLETNKKIGFVFADDVDGRAWADAVQGQSSALEASGYKYFLPDLYPVSTDDFSKHIAAFMKEECEICCGSMTTLDFSTFWKQTAKQDYKPEIVSIAKALLFPQAVEAVGASARNITVEGLWQPDWPYRDSITGKTCKELAEDYMAKTGEQWTAAIAQYAKFEWAVDVFKRVRNVDDKEDVIACIGTTKLDTCLGPIDFTARVDTSDLNESKRPVENVCKVPVGCAQWVGDTKFTFERTMVTNVNNPGLPVGGTVQPMVYGA